MTSDTGQAKSDMRTEVGSQKSTNRKIMNNQIPSTKYQTNSKFKETKRKHRVKENESNNYQAVFAQKNTSKEFDLEKRTLSFAKQVIGICKKMPNHRMNSELTGQLIRSSGSIGANYREANEALSKRDLVHRLKISRKEAKETQYWLELVIEANPELTHDIAPALQEAFELRKILSAIILKVS